VADVDHRPAVRGVSDHLPQLLDISGPLVVAQRMLGRRSQLDRPAPYAGMGGDEILQKRKKFLGPSLFYYYQKPVRLICQLVSVPFASRIAIAISRLVVPDIPMIDERLMIPDT
jgi:hypothetical protein